MASRFHQHDPGHRHYIDSKFVCAGPVSALFRIVNSSTMPTVTMRLYVKSGIIILTHPRSHKPALYSAISYSACLVVYGASVNPADFTGNLPGYRHCTGTPTALEIFMHSTAGRFSSFRPKSAENTALNPTLLSLTIAPTEGRSLVRVHWEGDGLPSSVKELTTTRLFYQCR